MWTRRVSLLKQRKKADSSKPQCVHKMYLHNSCIWRLHPKVSHDNPCIFHMIYQSDCVHRVHLFCAFRKTCFSQVWCLCLAIRSSDKLPSRQQFVTMRERTHEVSSNVRRITVSSNWPVLRKSFIHTAIFRLSSKPRRACTFITNVLSLCSVHRLYLQWMIRDCNTLVHEGDALRFVGFQHKSL